MCKFLLEVKFQVAGINDHTTFPVKLTLFDESFIWNAYFYGEYQGGNAYFYLDRLSGPAPTR